MEVLLCAQKKRLPGRESKPRSPACPAGKLRTIPPWTHILNLKSPKGTCLPFSLTQLNIYSFLYIEAPRRGIEPRSPK